MKIVGKISTFGGPDDMGVAENEDLALYWEDSQVAMHPELFLSEQPPGTTGLARRLDPRAPYIACRWSYAGYTKDELRDALFVIVTNEKAVLCRAVDWGPHETTGRIVDVSPAIADKLDLATDDEVTVYGPVGDLEHELPDLPERPTELTRTIALSSGHGLYVRGASGFVDEVDEARRMADRVAEILREYGHKALRFDDNTSHDQDTNLKTIVDWHNAQTRNLDVSFHLNAYDGSAEGTEVCYLSQGELADRMAEAIARAGGFVDRGGKYRDGLYFLNKTDEPAILLESFFCDNFDDCENYEDKFEAICFAIAQVLLT
jgi:N-acetylmuramoyl-L-alanine amidase